MKLYNANLSPYASRARIAIYATGVNVEIVPPPAQLGSDAYKQVNPIGKVPALGLDDGTVLPESDVIVQYIDELSGGKLSPATPEARARARLIGRIADLYIAPGLGAIFRQLNAKDRDPAKIAEGAAEAKKGLGLLEHYVEPGPYAVNGKLSHADCMVAPTLFFIGSILPRVGEKEPFANAPKAAAYWDAIQKDPSVARVLKEMAEALAERMKRA
jgi:glutathione S-transferase